MGTDDDITDSEPVPKKSKHDEVSTLTISYSISLITVGQFQNQGD